MKSILAIVSILALGISFNTQAVRLTPARIKALGVVTKEAKKELERNDKELQEIRLAHATTEGFARGIFATCVGIAAVKLLVATSKEHRKNGSEYRAITLDNNANHTHFQTLSPF